MSRAMDAGTRPPRAPLRQGREAQVQGREGRAGEGRSWLWGWGCRDSEGREREEKEQARGKMTA